MMHTNQLQAWLSGGVSETAARLIESGAAPQLSSAESGFGMKSRAIRATDLLRTAMYPGIFSAEPVPERFLQTFVTDRLQKAAIELVELAEEAYRFAAFSPEQAKASADAAVSEFLNGLPEIKRLLATDIEAAYLGDPAARNHAEIMLAYPTFEAVSIFRLAHSLFVLGVPLLPRIMTEYAHQKTGIDIHPGATIGESFFIDHGTGVVIGETCTIGDHVKLYQGVTLGAKSFENDENGNPIKGIKRHPDIGNRVIIYAGATILGGDTKIGDDSVIGGNVWLTRSVPAGSKVYNTVRT